MEDSIEVLCYSISFYITHRGNISFSFPGDTFDRGKLGIKRNTVAQGLNGIVHLITVWEIVHSSGSTTISL